MSNVSHTAAAGFGRIATGSILVTRGFGAFAAFSDALTIVAASVLSGVVYHLAVHDVVGDIGDFLTIGIAVASVFVGLRAYDRRYQVERLSFEKDRFRHIAIAWNVAFLCLLAVGFLLKETGVYSRGATVAFYFVGLGSVFALRALLRSGLQAGFSRGWFVAKRVFLFGTRARIEEFLVRYRPDRSGLLVVGAWYLPDHVEDDTSLGRGEVEKSLREAINHARALSIDDVFVVAPWSSQDIVEESTRAFLAIPASIHLAPERHLDTFSDIQISRIGSASCLRLARPPLTQGEILAKRAMDIVLSATGLLVLWPVLLAVAALIHAESGRPILFLQRRHGFNQKEFRIVKFRTMTCLEDGPSVRQATAGDERVTRVGRFLRRWNLDELPQLINVLKGDMSIVGPRPHALAHNREFEQTIANYARRHNVKPGITGWAQVNGLRGATDTSEKMAARVEHDLYYIDNWSVGFDLYIIFLTLFSRRVHWNAH